MVSAETFVSKRLPAATRAPGASLFMLAPESPMPLPPDVAKEAMDFARMHQKELAGYALASGDAMVAAQGALMRLSLDIFLKAYCRR